MEFTTARLVAVTISINDRRPEEFSGWKIDKELSFSEEATLTQS